MGRLAAKTSRRWITACTLAGALAGAGSSTAAYQLVLSPTNARVNEGADFLALVSIQGCTNPSNSVSVVASVQASGGTSSAPGADTGTPNPQQFDIGSVSSSLTVKVRTKQDSLNEPDETFELVLKVQGSGTLFCTEGVVFPAKPNFQATFTIVDRNPISITVSDPAPVQEGNSGTRPVDFVVRVSPPPVQVVTVHYATQDGTARAADHDYEPVSGTLTFDTEQTSRTVSVRVIGDTTAERNETFSLVLSVPSNHGVLTRGVGTATIQNDDAGPPPPPSGGVLLDPVGETNRTAAANSPVELAVRVSNAQGPVAGAVVTWRVQGDAVLVGASTVTTNQSGVAMETVRTGSGGGAATVFAQAEGVDGAVVFHIASQAGFATLFDPKTEAGPHSLAVVLDAACAQPSAELRSFCSSASGLSDDGRHQVVEELLPTDVQAQATVAREGALAQLRQLQGRLQDLRRGGARQPPVRVSLQLGRTALPAAFWSGLGRRAAPRSASHGVDAALAVATGSASPGDSRTGAVDSEDPSADERLGMFLSGSLTQGDQRSQPAQAGFRLDTKGVTGGVDYRLNSNFAIGLAGGYLNDKSRLQPQDGALDVNGWSVSSYGTYYREAFFVDGAASWGSNRYDVHRIASLPAPLGAQNVKGTLAGRQAAATFGLGYDAIHGGITFETFGRANWLDSRLDPFTETGGGVALAIDEQHVQSLLGEGGFEVSSAFSPSWGVLLLQIRVAAVHEFKDDERKITGHVAAQPESGDFGVPVAAPDRNYFHGAVGVAATLPHGWGLFANYDRDFAREGLAVGMVSAGLRVAF